MKRTKSNYKFIIALAVAASAPWSATGCAPSTGTQFPSQPLPSPTASGSPTPTVSGLPMPGGEASGASYAALAGIWVGPCLEMADGTSTIDRYEFKTDKTFRVLHKMYSDDRCVDDEELLEESGLFGIGLKIKTTGGSVEPSIPYRAVEAETLDVYVKGPSTGGVLWGNNQSLSRYRYGSFLIEAGILYFGQFSDNSTYRGVVIDLGVAYHKSGNWY